MIKLKPISIEVIEWVKKVGHPNKISESEAPQEVKDFINSHSCGDGFDYALWDGGYARPEDWLVDYDPGKFTVNQLEEFKDIWENNTLEF